MVALTTAAPLPAWTDKNIDVLDLSDEGTFANYLYAELDDYIGEFLDDSEVEFENYAVLETIQ